MLRTGQIAAPPIKVADGAGSKTGEYPSRRARRPPRTARHGTRTDYQPAPSEDDADWQAQSIGYSDGFSSPAPPFSGGTPRDTRAATKCQETKGLMIASPDAFGIVAHGVKPASDCAATLLKGLALLAPSAGAPAASAMAQGQSRQFGPAVQPGGASAVGTKVRRTRTRACSATPSTTTGSKRHWPTAARAARSSSRSPLDRATITLETWPSSSN